MQTNKQECLNIVLQMATCIPGVDCCAAGAAAAVSVLVLTGALGRLALIYLLCPFTITQADFIGPIKIAVFPSYLHRVDQGRGKLKLSIFIYIGFMNSCLMS